MSFSRRITITVIITLALSALSTVFCAPEAHSEISTTSDPSSTLPVVQGPAIPELSAVRALKSVKSSIRTLVTFPETHTTTAVITTNAKQVATDIGRAVGRPSSVAESVVEFALAQLGKPYVWGATGPSSYDCSGLVQTAYRHAGIQTTRTTKTLINEGSPVGRDELVRGDLVFTSSGHVGIYFENGQMIHAPQPGEVVKISTIWSFYAGRRLV